MTHEKPSGIPLGFSYEDIVVYMIQRNSCEWAFGRADACLIG
ncbi:hypothetical protein [Paenibacillus alvei]|nr:hypothetical protein [Paenibacillus alvei]